MGASQGELTRLGEATGLPAMVGATSVKVQHFASTRSDTQPTVPLTGQESARQSMLYALALGLGHLPCALH